MSFSKFPALKGEKSLHHEGTKFTKVSDIDISKFFNFVLFVTFVVKCFCLLWLRLNRRAFIEAHHSSALRRCAEQLVIIGLVLRRHVFQ